jgi:hypothetical protein
LSPNEKKLVGTWEFTGIDATGRLTLRADHTSETLFPDMDDSTKWEVLLRGSWRLEGNDLIMEEKPTFGPSVPGDPPRQMELTRITIREFGSDKLVPEKGGPYKRVK